MIRSTRWTYHVVHPGAAEDEVRAVAGDESVVSGSTPDSVVTAAAVDLVATCDSDESVATGSTPDAIVL